MWVVVLTLFPPAPAQPAFHPESPNSCIECHRSLEDKRLSEPVIQWSKSIHNEVGNTCDGCHGGDPQDKSTGAMSKKNGFYPAPEDEQVASFCGKCHAEISKDYLESTHGMMSNPNCVTCHGSHSIRRISINIIKPDKCTECHDYENPEKLLKILLSLHKEFHEAEAQLKLIRGVPIHPLKKELEKTWKDLRQVRMVSHTFDLPTIEVEAKKVHMSMLETRNEIDRLTQLTQARKRWGFLVVFLFMGLALLTYWYNKKPDPGE